MTSTDRDQNLVLLVHSGTHAFHASAGHRRTDAGFAGPSRAGKPKVVDDNGGEPAPPETGTDAVSRTVRIGVTGHMDLSPETVRLVADALRAHLRELSESRPGDVIGVSCLAPGADRVFAHVLLDLGGRLEVILPAGDYRDSPADADCRPTFDELLGRADSVHTIERPRARPEVYVAANDAMLDSIDALFAVWNGVRSGKPGGTANVVEAARSRRIPVTVIWPEGARRQG